jgi:nucleoside-diphosphate-sugar epimerase
MPRIFVTGSAGFIGAVLVHRLLRERERGVLEVRAFDLEPTAVDGCTALQGDVLDAAGVARAMAGCDTVVHLAAYLGVMRSDRDPGRCLDVNITGTRNVLEACVVNRVRRVVFVSSSEVYGENGTDPISETSSLRPNSVYAVSKLAGEEYVKAYATRHAFDFTVLRPFNAYGPGQTEEFVIPRFVRAVIEGRPPLVYGDGQQVRAFCSVDDIVEGVTLALFSPAAAGEVFNLGNDAGLVSILELGHKIAALSGNGKVAPRLVPYEQADRTRERDIFWRVPQILKAIRVLNYTPRVSLDEGIARCFDSVRALAKAQGPGPDS